MKIKSLEEYSSLSLVLEKYDPRAVLQIVTTDDKVIRTVPAHSRALNSTLTTDDYYVRLFLDDNKMVSGIRSIKRQPKSFYYLKTDAD